MCYVSNKVTLTIMLSKTLIRFYPIVYFQDPVSSNITHILQIWEPEDEREFIYFFLCSISSSQTHFHVIPNISSSWWRMICLLMFFFFLFFWIVLLSSRALPYYRLYMLYVYYKPISHTLLSIVTASEGVNFVTICFLFLNNIFTHIQSFIHSNIL